MPETAYLKIIEVKLHIINQIRYRRGNGSGRKIIGHHASKVGGHMVAKVGIRVQRTGNLLCVGVELNGECTCLEVTVDIVAAILAYAYE